MFRRADLLSSGRCRTSLRIALTGVQEPVLICTHSHIPFAWHEGQHLVVNPGAVSGSNNSDPRAQYALLTWTGSRWQAALRAVAYDLDQIQSIFRDTGFLEAGGMMAQALLLDIQTGQNIQGPCAAHLRRQAKMVGMGPEEPVSNEVRGQAVESLDGPTLPTETSGPWCRVRSWQQLLDQEPHWRYTDPRLRRAGHCLLGRGMNGMIALPSIRPSTYIAVGPVQVYETLTTASGWDAWFTQGAEIDTRQGGRVHLRWAGLGADGYTGGDGGAVLEADYPRRIVFQWKPGDSVTTVAFDLAPRGAGTNVCLKEWAHSDSAGDLAALVECAAACGDRIPRTAMKGNLLCFRQHVPERHPVET